MATRNALTPYLERAFATLEDHREKGVLSRETTVRVMAEGLSGTDLPIHWTAQEVREAALCIGQNVDARPYLGTLFAMPECKHYDDFPVEIVWSRKPKFVTDALTTDIVLGRGALVTERERDCWLGEDPVPWVRIILHLPCWLVATDYERERALHAILMGWALSAGGDSLVRRRPDIVAHAATLGRYGADNLREAQAIQHAQANPVTELRVLECGQLVWDWTQRAFARAGDLRSAPPLSDPQGTPLAKKSKSKSKKGTQLKMPEA